MKPFCLLLLMALPVLTHASEELLKTDPGPEDLVIVDWKKGENAPAQKLAVTSVAQRSLWGKPTSGFHFIALDQSGHPQVMNPTPHLPKGAEKLGPWQGLSWQPRCELAGGRGVLAATRTKGRAPQGKAKPSGTVDFFVWDKSAAEPRLIWHSSTPALEGLGKPFNSVALTQDGHVYASAMSMNPFVAKPSIVLPDSAEAKTTPAGALYHWDSKGGWVLLARKIAGANGVILMPDEEHLIVSSAVKGKVHVFQRSPDGRLYGPVNTLTYGFCLSAPDNLRLLDDGSVCATGTANGTITAVYMLFRALCGRLVCCGPSGNASYWKSPLTPKGPADMKLLWRRLNAPTTTVRLGDWWLGAQIFDGAIGCQRVISP